MKLPAFDLTSPRTLRDALAVLADRERHATPLAGGQTLLPRLASGAAATDVLVDLGRVDRTEGLHGIRPEGEGFRVGALTTHSELARSAPLGVLRDAASRIGTVAVRTRGTIGGSLAVASPSAEWCVSAVALDATVQLASADGSRRAPVRSLFVDLGTDADRPMPGELLTSVWLRTPARAGIAGHRDRVDGTATVVVVALVDHSAGASEVRVAVGGVGPAPRLSRMMLEAADRTPGGGVSADVVQKAVRGLGRASGVDGLVAALAHRAAERMTA